MLFTELDTEEVLAFLEVEAENCPGCGHPRFESFAPENEDGYDATVVVCHACDARRKAEKSKSDLDGAYSFATKRPPRAPRTSRVAPAKKTAAAKRAAPRR